jgi:hypothetical protein
MKLCILGKLIIREEFKKFLALYVTRAVSDTSQFSAAG